jgi:predicted DNA-binding transcriptional regulator YafY
MKSSGPAALEPFEIRQLQDDGRRGISAEALAVRYGCSKRTIYRYLATRVERIFIDGWSAWFALRGDDKAPQRLTPWEQA